MTHYELTKSKFEEVIAERDAARAELERVQKQFGVCSICGYSAWKNRDATTEECQYCKLQKEAAAMQEALDVKKLADIFVAWPLPESVCADLCATKSGYPHRTGTTLLAVVEARQMFEYVLAKSGALSTTAGRGYVAWEKVKPIVKALEMVLPNCPLKEAREALAHARKLEEEEAR